MKLNRKRLEGMALLLMVLLLTACEVRQWMYDDGRLKPHEESEFFADGNSSRPIVEGTVARGMLKDDPHFYEGKEGEQIAKHLPFELTKEVLTRGQDRFNIFCSACHGYSGRGNGMVVQRGFRPIPASFHSEQVRNMPVGYYFQVATNGKGKMPSYSAQVSEEDRWAIAAYIRVLQQSSRVELSKFSTDEQSSLQKALENFSAKKQHQKDSRSGHTNEEGH